MNPCAFFDRLAPRVAWLAGLVAAGLLAACGGGGLDGSGGPEFITWTGNSNGEVVLAANNQQIRFLTNGDLYYNGSEYSNVIVNNASVYLNGSLFGYVRMASGTAGGESCTRGKSLSRLNSGRRIKSSRRADSENCGSFLPA